MMIRSILIISLATGNILFGQSVWNAIGPDGGFLLTLAIAPSAPTVLYAGCDAYGGIYKSTDGGTQWEFFGMLTELGQALDIDVHPDSDNVAYAACGEGGLFKTADGGLNWNRVLDRPGVVYTCGIDPNNPHTIYAGVIVDTIVDYALYKSTDAGMSWSDSSFQGMPVLEISFYPDSLNTVFLGTSYGVHRSADAGFTWQFCGPPAPSAVVYSLAVAGYDSFYAGTYPDARDTGAVYKTINGGATWDTSIVLGVTAYGLAVDPDSMDIAYLAAGEHMSGTEGIFKTTNAGQNWFSANNGIADRMAFNVTVDASNPNVVYAVTDGIGGVYKSTDKTASWTRAAAGMRHTPVEAMCFDASNTLYAAVGWGTYKSMPCIFKSTDSGNTWDTLSTIPSPYYMTSIWDIKAHPGSSAIIYAGGMSHYANTAADPIRGLLYRTTDGGSTWNELWTPESIWIHCIEVDAVSGNIYLGTCGTDTARIYKIYRSTDNGASWLETSGWTINNNPILAIAVDPDSTSTLYAGTSGIIYKSTNYGADWVIKDTIFAICAFLVDPDSTNIIYAGSGTAFIDSGAVYKSTDAGETWNKAGLDGYRVNALVGSFGSSDTLYAGTGGKFLVGTGSGVFRSIDNGVSWDSLNQGLTAPFILSMAVNPAAPSVLFAGTMARGIFRYDQVGIEEGVRGTSVSSLSVCPNPFTEQTAIRFGRELIAKSAEIKIFNAAGRLVKFFLPPSQPALGAAHTSWDGTDQANRKLPSGVYFLQLCTDGYTETEKILLIK